VIIDSALDFDAKSGRTGTHSAEAIFAAVKREELSIDWLLETHAHADHLSAAPFLKKRTGAPIVIGEHITAVQKVFKDVFNLAARHRGWTAVRPSGARWRGAWLGTSVDPSAAHTRTYASLRFVSDR
jgi:glyoxylase-like metal-dependent hydrolase (beta-lactamase superfamily II)